MNRRRGLPKLKVLLGGALDRMSSLGRSALGALRVPGMRKNRRKLALSRVFERPDQDVPGEAMDVSNPLGGSPTQPAPRRSGVLGAVGTLLLWALPLVLAAAAFAVPLLGVRAYEYVMQSGYFHVREVIIDQSSTRSTMAPDKPYRPHLSREEILSTAGIGAGTHLLEADLEAMTRKLLEHPWIRWARIEKDLPDVLIVHVVEHVPSAYLAPHLDNESGRPTAGEAVPNLLLVDELGEVFAESTPGLTLPLPVVTGVGVSRLEPMDAELSRDLIAGLNVLRLWEGQGLSRRYPVGELRLLPGGAYALVVEVIDPNGARMGITEVVLGRGPFREKLLRTEFILEHLFAQSKVADYILLDVVDDLDPRAVELAGARVVVKADLGVDPIEALDELVRRESALPASAPERPVRRPRGNGASGRPGVAAPGGDAATEPEPEPLPASEEPPSPGIQNHQEDTDAPSEAAPLTGGRPAEDFGQE